MIDVCGALSGPEAGGTGEFDGFGETVTMADFTGLAWPHAAQPRAETTTRQTEPIHAEFRLAGDTTATVSMQSPSDPDSVALGPLPGSERQDFSGDPLRDRYR